MHAQSLDPTPLGVTHIKQRGHAPESNAGSAAVGLAASCSQDTEFVPGSVWALGRALAVAALPGWGQAPCC